MLKDFRVYQLALRFYRLCEDVKCPKHLRDQLSRASSSIALNLSEGSGRPTMRDRRRFFYIAMSSLRECQTVLELIGLPPNSEAVVISDQLGAQLYRLIEALKPTREELSLAPTPGTDAAT
jgi:four helix bundle protein